MPKTKYSEKYLEHKLQEGVKKLGGAAPKFSNPFDRGWPDRLVLLPGKKFWFVEVKSTGKDLSPLQRIKKARLEKMDIDVHVIDDKEKLDWFLKLIAR